MEGDASFSNVLKPGTGKIVLFTDEGQKDAWRVEGDWCTATAALTFGDENCDCPGAEFTVTVGHWTGHFFSGRLEDGQLYGIADRDRPSTGSRARLRVPYRPNGPQITIAVRGAGTEGTLEMRLPEQPDLVRQEKETMARFEKIKAELTARYTKQAAEAEKAVNAAQKAMTDREEVKKMPPDPANDQYAKESKATVLRSLADRTVMLTGNRAEGVTLWRKADALVKPAVGPNAPPLPAWFPGK